MAPDLWDTDARWGGVTLQRGPDGWAEESAFLWPRDRTAGVGGIQEHWGGATPQHGRRRVSGCPLGPASHMRLDAGMAPGGRSARLFGPAQVQLRPQPGDRVRRWCLRRSWPPDASRVPQAVAFLPGPETPQVASAGGSGPALSVRVVLMTCHSLNAKCPLVRARLRQRRRDEEKETQASGVSSHGLGGRCERTSRGAEEASGSAGDLAFPLAVCPPGRACLGPRTWGPLRRSALGTACGEGSDSRASEEAGVVKVSVKASSKQVQLPGVAFRLH